MLNTSLKLSTPVFKSRMELPSLHDLGAIVYFIYFVNGVDYF